MPCIGNNIKIAQKFLSVLHPLHPPIDLDLNAEQGTPFYSVVNQGRHATVHPRYLCLSVHHHPISKLVQ